MPPQARHLTREATDVILCCSDGIRLHGLYNNATPELPAPSFVLFVGDVAQCPTFQMSGDPTDRPYCAVDGDYVPDIYYGRFSATNPDQLQAILDKTMMYDRFTMPDPGYLDEVVLIADLCVDEYTDHGHCGIVAADGTVDNDATLELYTKAALAQAQAHGIPVTGTVAAVNKGGVEVEVIPAERTTLPGAHQL